MGGEVRIASLLWIAWPWKGAIDRRDVVSCEWFSPLLDDVAGRGPGKLGQGYADEREHLAGGDTRRRHVVVVDEGRHDHVQHALRMVGDVHHDEEVPAGARPQTGEASHAAQVVDRLPDLDDPICYYERLSVSEELSSLSKVRQLDGVLHLVVTVARQMLEVEKMTLAVRCA